MGALNESWFHVEHLGNDFLNKAVPGMALGKCVIRCLEVMRSPFFFFYSFSTHKTGSMYIVWSGSPSLLTSVS